jgi:hypothetical protein
MTHITVHLQGHYEVHETPFARTYKWYPAHITLECDCGEKLTLTGQSTVTTCRRCGTDHGAIAQDIQEREARLRNEVTPLWHHDTQAQEDQHLRDEASHPKGSLWRYNDITSRGTADERNLQ